MLQSSETTKSSLELLAYPGQGFENNYYTAQPRPGIGVCIAYMLDGFMVQFFPWADGRKGHEQYAAFIVAKATTDSAEKGDLFDRWPFLHCKESNMLLVKCMVEDGLNQIQEHLDANQNSPTDPAAGEAVE